MRIIGLILPSQYSETDDVGRTCNGIKAKDSVYLGFDGFHVDHQKGRHIKVEISKEKDEPYAFKRPVPEQIFPDQVTAFV